MIGRLVVFQLFSYSPLTNVNFPPQAMIVYETLVEVVSFDMIPADDVYPVFFDLPKPAKYNQKFFDMGFDGTLFLNNMGTLFAMGVLLLG